MAGKITYDVGFNVNTQGLKKVKSALQDLQNMKFSDLMKINDSTASEARTTLKSIQQDAQRVEGALEKAFNPKLNTINVKTFNSELSKSKMTMNDVYTSFSRAGATGEAAFRSLTSQVLSMNMQIKESHAWLDKMATTLANTVKWNVASTAVNSLSRSVQQAWGFVKSLDGSLNDIRIVTGKSSDEMARFAEQANKAAGELGRTTTDYTKAALIYAQQGLSDKEVEQRARITLKAANVTGQSTDDVSEQLTAVWNGYKVTAEEAELYVDRLAAVAATTASDLEELSTGMSKVASAAAAMGVGEEQLAAQLSTIISVTKQAPESVGTALRTVYARISDIKAGIDQDGVDLGRYSGKMAELGFNVLDVNGRLRDMGQVIEEIGGRWQDLTREQQISLTQTMAGQRQYNNLLALFDNFEQYNEALQTAQNSAGTLEKQQAIYMDSIKAHLNELTTAIEGIYKSLTDPKAINGLIDGLTTIAKLVNTVVTSIGGGAGVLTTLGTLGFNVFSNQIAGSIQTTINNIQRAKAQEEQFKAILEEIQQMYKGQSGDVYTQTLLAKRDQLIRMSGRLSPQQFNTAQKTLNDLSQTTGQLDILKEGLQSLENSFKNFSGFENFRQKYKDLDTALKDSEGFEILHVQFQKFLDETKTITPQFNIITENFKNFRDSLKVDPSSSQDYFKILQESANELFKNVQGNETLWNSLSQGVRKSVQEANEALQGLNIEALSGEQLEKKATVAYANIVSVLRKEIGTAQEVFNSGADNIQKYKEKIKQLEAQIQKLRGTSEKQFSTFGKLFKTQDIVNVTRSFATILNSFKQLSNLGSIVTDKSLSDAEKLSQVVSNLAINIPMLIPAFQALSKTIGGPITIAIGVAAAALEIFSAKAKAQRQKLENEIVQYQKDIDKENKTQEQIEANKELYKSLEELNTKFKEGQINRYQLSNEIESLIEQYGLEGEAVESLKNNYDDLTESLLGLKQEDLTAQLKSVKKQREAAESALENQLKLGNIDYSGEGDRLITFFDDNYEEGISSLAQQLFKRILPSGLIKKEAEDQYGIDLQGNTDNVLQLISILQDFKETTQDQINEIEDEDEKDKQKEQLANLYEYFDDLLSSQIIEAANRAQSAKDQEQEIQPVLDFLDKLTDETSNFYYKNQDSIQEYSEMSEYLTNVLKEMDRYSDEQIPKVVESILKQNVPDLYKDFNNKLQLFEKLGLNVHDTDEAVEQVIASVNELDATNLAFLQDSLNTQKVQNLTWQQLLSYIKNSPFLTGVSFPTLEEATENYSLYNGLDPNKNLKAEDYEKLDQDIQRYYALMADGTYKMIGDALSFYDAIKEKKIEPFIQNLNSINQTIDDLSNLKFVNEQLDDLFFSNQEIEKIRNERYEKILQNNDKLITALGQQYEKKYQENFETYTKSFQKRSQYLTDKYTKELTDKYIENQKPDYYNKKYDYNDYNDYAESVLPPGYIDFIKGSKNYDNLFQSALKQVEALTKEQFENLNPIDNPEFFEPVFSLSQQAVDKIASMVGIKVSNEMSRYENSDTDIQNKTLQYFRNLDDIQNRLSASDTTDYQREALNTLNLSSLTADQENTIGNLLKLYGTDYGYGGSSQVLDVINKLRENIEFTDDQANKLKDTLQAILTEKTADDINKDLQDLTKYYQQVQKYQTELLLARQVENNDQLRELLNNKTIGEEAYTQAMIQRDRVEDLQGIDTEALKEYSKYLQDIADDSDKLADSLEKNDEAAQIVAKSIIKMNRGLETLSKNWENWSEVLSSSNEQTQAYQQTMSNIQSALADLLDINEEFVSEDFVKNHLEDIAKAATEGGEAIDELKEALQTDTFINILKENGLADLSGELQNQFDKLQLSIPDIEVGAELKTGDFLEQANKLIQDCGMTVDQANAMFDALGFEPTFAEQSVNVPQEHPEVETWQEVSGWERGTMQLGPIPIPWYYPKFIQHSQQTGRTVTDATFTIPSLTTNGKVPKINKLTKKAGGGGFASAPSSSGKKSGGSGGKGGKGGSGGSGSSAKPNTNQKDTKKPLEDERDIYHDINIQIEKINRNVQRLQKQQDRLYGKTLLDNLNKQTSLLDQQKNKLKEKQQLQKEDLKNQQEQLKTLGAVFDEYGNIANYMQVLGDKQDNINALTNKYNDLVALYNASTDSDYKSALEDEMKYYEKTMQQAQEDLSKTKTKIGNYDNLRTAMEDLKDEIDEITQKEIEINIKKFKYELEIRLDMREAAKDWNKFKREVLQHVDVLRGTDFDKIIADARQNQADVETYFHKENGGSSYLEALTKQATDLRTQIEKIDQTGWSDIYGDNKAQAMSDLKDDLSSLMDSLEDIRSLIDNIDEAYLNTVDDIKEQWDKQIEDYKFVNELLQHNIDLVNLLYGDKNYQAMDSYYQQMHNNSLRELESLANRRDLWKKLWDQAVESGESVAAQKFKQNWMNTVNEINNMIKQSIDTLKNQYENTINGIFDKMNRGITNGKGLDYLGFEWDLMNEKAEDYLDTINSAFAIQQTERKYQKALNDTKDIKNQKVLKDLMDEQLTILKNKQKITQYDIDRAEKLLQVEQARIALEDMRSAKTTLRLKRDSQGNYSYEYHADNDAIADAQDALAQAQNELYNFDKAAYQTNLNQIYNLWQEFLQKYKQINLDASLSDEERQMRLDELTEEYGDRINLRLQQNMNIRNNLYDSAFQEYANLYENNLQNFDQMLQGENGMIPMWTSGIQQMADKMTAEGGFLPVTQESLEKVKEETNKWKSEIEETAETAGISLGEISQGIDSVTEDFGELIEANDQLLERFTLEEQAAAELKNYLDELASGYDNVYNEAVNAVGQLYEFVQAQEAAAASYQATASAYVNMINTMQAANAAYNSGQYAAGYSGGGSDGSSSSGGSNGSGSSSGGGSSSSALNSAKQNAIEGVEEAFDYYAFKARQADRLATGGYTGEWGNEQKMAFLHEKELVLNKEDTQNLLNTISLLREMFVSANLSAANRMSDIHSKISRLDSAKEAIQQNVKIDANFPNVNSKREIEQAFSDLVNLAAQRVLR